MVHVTKETRKVVEEKTEELNHHLVITDIENQKDQDLLHTKGEETIEISDIIQIDTIKSV